MIINMKTNSLKTNAILNVIYSVINILFPLITFPYVSRILLVDNIGKVNFFNSLANYAIIVGSLGISTYGIRAVARVKDDEKNLNKVTQELLFINLFVSFFVVICLLISLVFINKFKNNLTLFCIYTFYVLVSPIAINWLYSGLEQYKYITLRSLIFKLISLGLIFLLVKDKNDVVIYSLIMIFANVAGYICNIVHSRKLVRFERTNLEFKQHIKPMLVLFASILAIYVYIHLDTIMLGFICDDYQVGLYTVSVYVKTALLNAVNAISAVLFPRISYYISNGDEKRCDSLIRKSTTLIFALSIPLTAFFIQNAYDSIMFLGGVEYEKAVLCMQIIMPILIVSGFSNILGNQILIPRGKENKFLIAVIIGALVDLILNFLFMPGMGCVGAAISTLIAELVQMCIQFCYCRKFMQKNINFKSLIKIIVGVIFGIIVLDTFVEIIEFTPFANLLVNAIAFFGVYGIILILTKEEETMKFIDAMNKKAYKNNH